MDGSSLPCIVSGAPRLVAGGADPLWAAVVEHLERRMPREERHAREPLPGEREDPALAHELRRPDDRARIDAGHRH